MRHTSILASVRRLRRHAKRLTPELSKLGDAVGDTLDAAASAANDTARSVTRRVRRQRTARRRHRGVLALLLIGGIGAALVVLARAEASRSNDVVRPDTPGADEPGGAGLPGDADSYDTDSPADRTGETSEPGDRTATASSVV